ncbi:glycosyltransferase family 4 protein [Bacillus sp. FJAT-45350]|uniref:glycosyltransferase family 4 protein n=1 Tax=Bacillus sp. FJAT-45350 TaxID=2011014 RepID=UPI000BB977D3|nr:glycosyltransferase family 4 protein [Bacillus sp. FJAT-45350]
MERNWKIEEANAKQKVNYDESYIKKIKQPFSVLFLLPVRGGSGGTHSVVQETMGLRSLNVGATIAIQRKHQQNYLDLYPECKENFIFYKNHKELIRISSSYDIVVATIFSSIAILKKIIENHPFIRPAYYIQDYEPLFYSKEDRRYKVAQQSYEEVPNIYAFAKTQWLCNVVEKKHGINVQKVEPSLDHEIYKPTLMLNNECGTIRLVAMIRPSTQRRSPQETLRVLQKIKEKYEEKVNINIFGCSDKELTTLQFSKNFTFTNYGILKRGEVAKLLQASDIFLDLSSYQAFGRTGLEAMAVGCSTVLPLIGGTNEYATHKENCYLVDVKKTDEVLEIISQLIENQSIRELFSQNGKKTASNYSIEKASRCIYSLFIELMGI